MQLPKRKIDNLQFRVYNFLALLVVIVFIVISRANSPIYAQYELTGIPSQPTCDLCGKCRDAGGVERAPPDWNSCHSCLYNSANQPQQNKTWTPIGCIGFDIGQPGGFVQTVLRFITGIAGGLSFLGFLWGGFQLTISRGDPGRVNAGRSMILASLGAFLLILFSVFLLHFIGVEILALPGFQKG